MPVSRTPRAHGMVLGVVLALAGCVDREFITVHDKPPGHPVGGTCNVDAECDSTRCIAGICKDNGCGNDGDCREDEICVFGLCHPEGDFACKPDQAPLISVTPSLSVDFGEVAIGQSVDETVTVANVGDCLLTLSGVDLAQTSTPGFTCDPCDASVYPQRVPPQQQLDITVHYSPVAPGDATGTLLIHGDDVTAGDQGLVSVALHADYNGIPALVIEPEAINFGYVPFVSGGQQGSATQQLQITNRGTGNASLVIERMFVDHGIEFAIDAAFDAVSPDAPLVVPPYDANDPTTVVTVNVSFTPDRNDDFSDRVIVRDDQNNAIPVEVTGSSLGPPEISVSTTDITYKCGLNSITNPDVCPNDEAYPVGVVTFRQVTITNSGESALNVNMTIGGAAGDYTVSPSFIPPIPAHAQVPISVFYAPSAPSDPGNPLNPAHSVDAFLNITSNDNDPPTDVLQTVALHGFAKGGSNDQVLKLEMTYENADNSWAGNDFRDVNLEVESPHGSLCEKPLTSYATNGDVLDTHFFCGSVGNDDWNTTATDGHASWIGLGAFEEPERVLVSGLGPTTDEGGIFTARVYYMEDCANIPTGLLADILGIGGSILLGVLGGAIGVPVAVPPQAISDTIANHCFDHSSSLTTLHVTLDGVDVADPQHRLDHKGDVFEMAHLKRTSGQFCDPAIGLQCP